MLTPIRYKNAMFCSCFMVGNLNEKQYFDGTLTSQLSLKFFQKNYIFMVSLRFVFTYILN